MVDLAVIPIGGAGSRLYPLTHGGNRALLPLGDRTMLQIALSELDDAGVQEFVVVVDNIIHFKKIISPCPIPKQPVDERQVLNIEEFNKLMRRVHLVQQSGRYPGGLASGILACRDYIKNAPFIVLLCDDIVVSSGNASKQVIEAFEETSCWSIGLTRVSQCEITEFGIVDIQNLDGTRCKICCAVEKRRIQDTEPKFGIVGRYVFGADSMTAIEDSLDAVRCDPEFGTTGFHLTCAIDKKASEGLVVGELFNGNYFHTGTMHGYLRALRWLLNNKAADGRDSV